MNKLSEYTESALIDAIHRTWSHFADRRNPDWQKRPAGMYYLRSFIDSIWEHKPLEINLEHFDENLKFQLEKCLKESPTKFNKVFKRSILEYLGRYEGSAYDAAERERLIRWRFV